MRAPAVLLLGALAACSASTTDEARATFGAGGLVAEVDLTRGTLDLSREGRAILEAASADALVVIDGETRLLGLDGAAPLTREGDVLVGTVRGLELRWSLRVDETALVAALEVVNRSGAAVQVLRVAPLVVEPSRGARLGLGARAGTHRVLENGRAVFFDQTAQVVTGDVERFALAEALPIPLRGHSISNWSHAVVDLLDPRASLVAGFLSAELAIPTVGLGARGDALDTWVAEGALVFHGKALAPEARLSSEALWIAPSPPDPLAALEAYARAIAAHQRHTVWTARDGGRPVPNGWNSWSGGSGSGGHGQTIDQATFDDALARMGDALGEFGLGWMQLDDGWQARTGDWDWRADRFPRGAPGVVEPVRARGLEPGLWMAPFMAVRGSSLARAHPDWMMAREDGLAGAAGKDGEALDPSSPEVRAHLEALGRRLRDEGWRWVKLDFSYYSLLGKLRADPTMTQVEAWRGAWRAFRRGLGDEAFLLGVGVTAANAGVVDGMRLTLDDGPRWDEGSPDDLGGGGALKSTVRTAARRWFYANRTFVAHPDLLFFRSYPDAQHPPLTLEESRTFATWVGLTGGVVKIGDRMDDLFARPENVDVVRRLLPAYPVAARPLDVLTRDYPETFEAPLPDGGRLVGLFHWGSNRDLGTAPPTRLDPDAPRLHRVRCDTPCHLYDFWAEAYLGQHEGDATVEVAARRVRLLAVRPATGEPALLGTNRHVTMGAMDLDAARWDASARTFTVTIGRAVRGTEALPWEDRLALWAPEAWVIDRVEGATVTRAGEVVRLAVRVAPEQVGRPHTIRVVFR